MKNIRSCVLNVFLERRWRALTYECVYLHTYKTSPKSPISHQELDRFFTTDAAPQQLERLAPRPGYCHEQGLLKAA